jgi:hypothetical protein
VTVEVAGYAALGESGGTLVLADTGDDPGPALEPLSAWLGEHGYDEIDTYAADARRIRWLEAHGFTYRRSSFDLQRGIDPPLAPAVWPSAFTVARYRRGEDDAAVDALIFLDAALGRGPRTHAAVVGGVAVDAHPGVQRWVARREQRPVGWVVGRVFSDRRGWIPQLAVARSARGLGLGASIDARPDSS